MHNEAETETAKRQVGEHGLFLRLAYDVTSCVVAAELESQSEFGRLDVLFDLRVKRINVNTDATAAHRLDFLQKWILMPVK